MFKQAANPALIRATLAVKVGRDKEVHSMEPVSALTSGAARGAVTKLLTESKIRSIAVFRVGSREERRDAYVEYLSLFSEAAMHQGVENAMRGTGTGPNPYGDQAVSATLRGMHAYAAMQIVGSSDVLAAAAELNNRLADLNTALGDSEAFDQAYDAFREQQQEFINACRIDLYSPSKWQIWKSIPQGWKQRRRKRRELPAGDGAEG